VLCKRQEVSICVEQRQSVLDAPGSNQRIYGFPYGDTQRSQRPVVLGRLDGKLIASQINVLEGIQSFLHPFELPLIANTLQYFSRNQIAHRKRTAPEERIQK